MIVGKGLMARAFAAFEDRKDVIVFASGVSDSAERSKDAFERERLLLESTIASNPDTFLIYFSTCSIFDAERRDSAYVQHKVHMEAVIAQRSKRWLVFRLGLAIGPRRGGTTLHEFLLEKITNREHFEVWAGAIRYPIDVEDVVRIATLLVDEKLYWNQCVNIATRAFPIMDFVSILSGLVGTKALYTTVERGQSYLVRTPELDALKERMALDWSPSYLDRVLRKYLAPAVPGIR